MVTKTRSSAQLVSEDTRFTTNIRRTAISLAVAAALPGVLIMPATAFAQDTDDESVVEEIITTGFRSSLRNSMMMKQNSDSIVEAVTAEDIGKLPDSSIAEALARLPGLTAQRLNGRGQQISVRGLGPDFTTALLNGREQVTTGDNRGVEFDQYPSELLSSVVVYKTPDASLIGAGLAGTADLRTIRPLAYGQRVLAANLRYEWTDLPALNAGSSDSGERATLTYVDQFADDTVGVAFGYSYMSNPGQEERFNAWGYPDNGAGSLVIGGAKPYVRSSELDRKGVIGVLEYQPSDTFKTALDVYYSDFEETQLLRGIELPLFWSSAQLQPGFTVEDGLITQGEFDGVVGVMRNDVTARKSNLFAAGLNFDFQITDTWHGIVDLSNSSVDRDDIILETYSGTGYAQSGASDNLGFSMTGTTGAVFAPSLVDYSDPNLIVITDPQGWGGGNVQAGYDNEPTIEDTLNQIQFAVDREFNGAMNSIEFGVNYATREKKKIVNEFIMTLGGNTEAPLPSNTGLTDLSFLGIGDMISYDPIQALHSGIYTFIPNNLNPDVTIKSWEVQEDVTLGYVQVGLDTTWGVPVTGNFGVQILNVDQSSSALAASGGQSPVAQKGGTDWTEVLPSINLSFDIGNDKYIRVAAARTVARARMDQMRASMQYSWNENFRDGTDLASSPWSGSGGNPEVKPWVANALDLSFEKYFADGSGYVSIAAFYKDLEEFIVELPIVFDFTGFPVPVDSTPPITDPTFFQGYVTAPVNGQGGSIKGLEFSLSLSGEIFTDALRNFGLVGNYSSTKSSIKPIKGGPEIPIPGLSEDVANITLYYENDSFSARVSNRYRSEFLGEVTGFGGGRDYRQIDSESVLDAQLSYNFSGTLEGLTLLLQGFNLTDEPLRTFSSLTDNRLIADYQRYGKSFMIGASYRWE
jgi:iron complex outermembrane recepter protein